MGLRPEPCWSTQNPTQLSGDGRYGRATPPCSPSRFLHTAVYILMDQLQPQYSRRLSLVISGTGFGRQVAPKTRAALRDSRYEVLEEHTTASESGPSHVDCLGVQGPSESFWVHIVHSLLSCLDRVVQYKRTLLAVLLGLDSFESSLGQNVPRMLRCVWGRLLFPNSGFSCERHSDGCDATPAPTHSLHQR